MSTLSHGSAKNQIQDSNKLLNQLLECVQQCQKLYGGKTQLATEFDHCVVSLCITIEAIFLHGLRTKPQVSISILPISTLQQVTDIVSNTLNFTNDNPSFWLFVKEQLTKHEQDRYNVLKHIWTDSGRGKAWIRSTLNERSLERYLHTVLSNPILLKNYYEDWAFLRDDEKNSMLPNMAAGLGSILFAISIDKPELNSGKSSLHKSEQIKSRPEPIIEAPIKGTIKDPKKKRRVAKQIILFDEEDDDGRESTSSSLPSVTSSDSMISETSSTQGSFNKSCNTEDTIQKVMDSSTSDTADVQIRRKLSIENSGSRDRYAMYLEGPLTPLPHAQPHIGELTPISVDVNESDHNSEPVESPSDICAVLTNVETKNREQIGKLNEKIDLLTKENENLNEQLRKYMGAVQMLKTDDASLQTALQGLQLETNIPDYKTEAKLYEQKLVQVAEMHAELMDFNIVLQQTLCQKETVMESLNHELEELRGPMINSNTGIEESAGSVNVWIPSAFLTGTGSDSHHVYQIFLRAGSDEWNIYRRYAQFYALHSDLRKLDPVLSKFDFPPKKSLGNKESSLVEKRRKRLQIYLRRVLRHWPELSQCNSRFLLEQHLTFFKDQKTTKKENKRSIFPSRQGAGHSSTSDNHYTGL